MEKEMQMKQRDSQKAFKVFKSHVEKVMNGSGYAPRFDEAFEYIFKVPFHHFQEKLIKSLNQLEKLLNEEEFHTRNCKEALKVIEAQFQSIFNPWIMTQSEFIDAFYQGSLVSYTTFRTKCINDMGELEKLLNAEEEELNEIEKLNREREQIEKDMLLKEREKIAREMQLKVTEVIERDTDKDEQTEGETVNEGEASDASLVFTGSDASSEQQVESSSIPRYDSDADGTQENDVVWDT